mmetsp:Transcript_29211/g.113359  ORF Transcript_29211/g.113359 Transcript_29211/m.113359 type:complete len:379 (-) Transcript_29211:304-1440(-)|eukprot:CAMPEP_0113960598 /NCGR_PEP_ID=MMETSP0011_2-20120614/4808_1 /TAXON_ID=101924 /ORGANISM="Rhodosorus marinus" /LENGTH=378 /DNA_ID=CAMNT_0000972077 /DNA_START=474 /DNA_END=1610 /DNA_ORIENTATION=- /assembly_acc=CAM_ASM_000156
MGEENEKAIEDLTMPCPALDAKFHPQAPSHLMLGLVDGSFSVYDLERRAEPVHSIRSLVPSGLRVVSVTVDGKFAVCGASDGTFCTINIDTGGVRDLKKIKRKSGDDIGITAIASVGNNPNMMVVGEDEGMVRLWDMRSSGFVLKRHEHLDYVSDISELGHGSKSILTSSADGCLGVWDLRTSSNSSYSTASPALKVSTMSAGVDDELLSLAVVKRGRKVVCGSSDGHLNIFSKADWSDISDRFPGHPHSVDAIVKVDEDTIFTGSSDGMIRVIQLQPNKFLGLAGKHGDLPIERLSLSCDQRVLASCSHDEVIKFYDVADFYHESDDTAQEQGQSRIVENSQPDSHIEAPVQLEPRRSRKKKKRKTTVHDPAFFSGI